MKRIVIATLVAGAALVVAGVGGASPKGDLCVGGPHCYSSVQAALDNASSGATIRIGPGTFSGGVTITRDVTLVGVDAHASKVSGGGPVITIGSTTSAPTVTLERLTITGGLTTANAHAPECGLDVPVCGIGAVVLARIAGDRLGFAITARMPAILFAAIAEPMPGAVDDDARVGFAARDGRATDAATSG